MNEHYSHQLVDRLENLKNIQVRQNRVIIVCPLPLDGNGFKRDMELWQCGKKNTQCWLPNYFGYYPQDLGAAWDEFRKARRLAEAMVLLSEIKKTFSQIEIFIGTSFENLEAILHSNYDLIILIGHGFFSDKKKSYYVIELSDSMVSPQLLLQRFDLNDTLPLLWFCNCQSLESKNQLEIFPSPFISHYTPIPFPSCITVVHQFLRAIQSTSSFLEAWQLAHKSWQENT
jgi:hypothetical protein